MNKKIPVFLLGLSLLLVLAVPGTLATDALTPELPQVSESPVAPAA